MYTPTHEQHTELNTRTHTLVHKRSAGKVGGGGTQQGQSNPMFEKQNQFADNRGFVIHLSACVCVF